MTELVKKGLTPESETPSAQAKGFLGGAPSKQTSGPTLAVEGKKFLKAASEIIEEIRVSFANSSIQYLTSDERRPGLTQERRPMSQSSNHKVDAGTFVDLLNLANEGNVVYERNAA